MKKRLLKVAIVTALTVAFAAPAFANPFSDVPANHWAYTAVNKLAQEGVVEGYQDGTFRGDKSITRYEMAQIVAKAMNKNLSGEQKATVDKLSQEYASELNSMGVKVDSMQNQLDKMVKFDGDARVRYLSADNDGAIANGDLTEYRVRLGATAKVNDDTSIYARITSGDNALWDGSATASIDNAYANTKVFGINTKIGRQDYTLGQGMLASPDSRAIMNGISMAGESVMAFGGKEANSAAGPLVQAYGGQATFKIGAPVTVAALRLDDKDYYAASTGFNLFPGLRLSGEYGRNDSDDATAYQVKAGIGSTGLSVAYNDIEAGALPYDSAFNLKAAGSANMNDFYALSVGNHVKGMEYQYNKDFAKNTNLDVKYQDIQDHGKNVIATASVKF
jgi:hypothetical protein